jgi:hypothetical protein
MYLFKISFSHSPKNKLQEAVLAYVKEFERICFQEHSEVLAFLHSLNTQIASMCDKFPRCKAIRLDVMHNMSHCKYDDFSVSISELFYGHFLEGKEVSNGSI